MFFSTSISDLSFKARYLKAWIQSASSLAKKICHLDFSNFVWELRNESVIKLAKQIVLHL